MFAFVSAFYFNWFFHSKVYSMQRCVCVCLEEGCNSGNYCVMKLLFPSWLLLSKIFYFIEIILYSSPVVELITLIRYEVHTMNCTTITFTACKFAFFNSLLWIVNVLNYDKTLELSNTTWNKIILTIIYRTFSSSHLIFDMISMCIILLFPLLFWFFVNLAVLDWFLFFRFGLRKKYAFTLLSSINDYNYRRCHCLLWLALFIYEHTCILEKLKLKIKSIEYLDGNIMRTSYSCRCICCCCCCYFCVGYNHMCDMEPQIGLAKAAIWISFSVMLKFNHGLLFT